MMTKTFRILLIEDHPMNRDMLVRRLRRRGFYMLEAVDGLQGVAVARQHHPDLILLDISIPEIDGYEVARRLRADPQTAGIPIVALTAHALEEDRQRALDAGCDEYTTKPVDFKALLAIIERILQEHTEA